VTERPSATVVIAAYNRHERLVRLLNGLAEQDCKDFDVVVVDDGSEPPLSVDGAGDGLAVRVIRQPNGGAARARHAGISAATGDVVILVDDDMIVSPRFVSSHLKRHADGADVAIGRFTVLGDSPLLDFQMGGLERYFQACERDESSIVPERLCTGNVSIRRSLYEQVGGFDPALRRCEDKELGIRLGGAGASFGFARGADIWHDDIPLTADRWLRVAFEYGEADVAIERLHPEIPASSPWKILADTMAPARAVISVMMRMPGLMRPASRMLVRAGRAVDRLKLRRVAVPLFGLAHSLTYFAGVVQAHGGADPARRARREWTAARSAASRDGLPQRVRFGPVSIDVISKGEVVERVMTMAAEDGGFVVTPNVDILVHATRDPRTAYAHEHAALVLADGAPIVALSRLLGLPLREKVSGSDLIVPILQAAASRNVPVFFFGGSPEVFAAAEERLRTLAPGLNVVGRASPWFNPARPTNQEAEEAIEAVRASGARLVVMAMGAPKEGQFFATYPDRLPHVAWVCFGASLDFVAERVQRAPVWMQRSGLEWTYRLYLEPGRLWKRYLVRDLAALPIFLGVVWQRVRGRDLVEPAPGPDSVWPATSGGQRT
jgi:N-acetylglucosaminyldiphosphoundecaprenol N-acetyl-beta-D-mannosaminyltransferase